MVFLLTSSTFCNAISTTASENPVDLKLLYKAITVQEIRRLVLDILPYELLQEINALDRTSAEFKPKCNSVFAQHMGEKSSADNQQLADWQSHTMLTAVWLDVEVAAKQMQKCLPIAFKLLLDGFYKIYARAENFWDNSFDCLLNRAASYHLPDFTGCSFYFGESKFFDALAKKLMEAIEANFVDATIKSVDVQSTTSSVLADVYQAIAMLALKLIPKILYPTLMQKNQPIDATCWEQLLSKVLYSTTTRRTNYILAKLYFNPAEFLASLTSTELLLKAIKDLLIEVLALQTLATKLHQRIVDQLVAKITYLDADSKEECYSWLHHVLDIEEVLQSCCSKF